MKYNIFLFTLSSNCCQIIVKLLVDILVFILTVVYNKI
jgi:hypothetical protein